MLGGPESERKRFRGATAPRPGEPGMEGPEGKAQGSVTGVESAFRALEG